MPYIYPTDTTNVSDSFQDHVNRGSVNPGTDYTAAYGSPVYAVASGTVTDASNSNGGGGGRTVHIDHDDGSGSDYLHLSQVTTGAGQWVDQGALLGYSGASGYGQDWYYGPHLHISFRYNHAHGYGNSGNVDFDAIMRSQPAPTPEPPRKEDTDMRIISVPGGTIALVGEYTGRPYSSTGGGEGFSIGSNTAAYGESSGLTEDQAATLVNEANARRSDLVADVSASVLAQLPGGTVSTSRSWARVIGLIVVALILFILAALAHVVFPDAADPASIVLVALGSASGVLSGFSVPGRTRPETITTVHEDDDHRPQHRGDAISPPSKGEQ
jgi:hypothetical protein